MNTNQIKAMKRLQLATCTLAILGLVLTACTESPTVSTEAETDATASDLALFKGPPNNDNDGDGVPNKQDNCPNDANPDQTDSDGDGVGDACESVGDGTDCKVDFDLVLDGVDPLTGGVGNDGLGTYRDGVDHVIAFTGAGDGFRFDTDGGGGRLRNDRNVYFDFSKAPSTVTDLTGVVGLSDTDTRLNKSFSPLNLCAMGVGESSSVVVGVGFQTDSGAAMTLKYGCPLQPVPDPSTRMTVTKTAANEWDFSGSEACLDAEQQPVHSKFPMPIHFTITAQ